MKKAMGRAVAVLLCALAAFSVLAAGELPPAELVRAEKEATQKRFPDSDTVLLYDREDIRYEANGLSVSTVQSPKS